MNRLDIYFITTPEPHLGRSLGYLLIMAWRHPRMSWRLFLCTILNTICPDLNHVAVGDDGVVVSPRYNAVEHWPADAFVASYPRLSWCFEVPIRGRTEFPTPGGWSNPALIALHCLTRGMCPRRTRDCVAYATSVLRSCGHRVPRSIVTPAQLFEYLRHAGFQQRDLGRLPATAHRSDHRQAGFHDQGRAGTDAGTTLHRKGQTRHGPCWRAA